ncbi:MAG TPA: hypothetical protein VLW85_11030 [Myxococcales bacterium]|nr:hypothetical protein [Myxococcales bacterium]
MIALFAAAHLYVLPWKLLFLLPGSSCGITMLRYGPADGKWERGSNPQPGDCEFRVTVTPGPLLPAWVDKGPSGGDLDVSYQVQGSDKMQSVSLKAETVTPQPVEAGELKATAAKVKNSVRVEVTNKGQKPVLLGDSVALRGKPKDACVGPGPAAVLQPGETLVDQRPGLLSPSMKVWVAAFTGEKECRWVEVPRK